MAVNFAVIAMLNPKDKADPFTFNMGLVKAEIACCYLETVK